MEPAKQAAILLIKKILKEIQASGFKWLLAERPLYDVMCNLQHSNQ
jgi:hypothetical protein